MMTYPQFVAEVQRRQRLGIEAEQLRYKRAARLWQEYKNAMSAIGLHDLTRREVEARKDQLRTMAATVEDTHGDSDVMRWSYESFTERGGVFQ